MSKFRSPSSGDPEPIPASVVVLTRFEGREVYLIQRSPKLRFLPGYWAFPGGALEDLDSRGGASTELALARSAARELFEETGILVPGLVGEPDREALLEEVPDASSWMACDEDSAWFEAWEPFAEVVTPRFSLRRFRAHFFHLDLPEGQAPSILDGELVDGRWVEPASALAEWERGELLLAPPSLYLLRRLVGQPLAEALEEARAATTEVREGRLLQQAEHAPGIIAVPLSTRTLPPATTTNTYLLGVERFYCLDPATTDEGELELLFDELERRRGRGHELVGVVVTHHHADHTGGVEAVAKRCDVPVFAHVETFRRTRFEGVECRELVDEDRLDLGRRPGSDEPWTARVLHTPGHAPGHLAFLENHGGHAIVGDLVSTLSTIVIDPEDGDMAQYLASLERVRDESIGILFPAHGMPAPKGTAKLASYLRHRRAREAKLAGALTDTPQSSRQLVEQVYDDVDARLWPLAERSLLAGLLKLQSESRAHPTPTGWHH